LDYRPESPRRNKPFLHSVRHFGDKNALEMLLVGRGRPMIGVVSMEGHSFGDMASIT